MSSIPLPALSIHPQENDPISMYAKLMGIQNMQQERRLREQEITAATRQNEQTQAVNNAYHDALETDENGAPKINQQKLTDALARSGHGAAVPGILKGLTDYQKSQADLQDKQNQIQTQQKDSLGLLGSAIQQSKYDPHLADVLIEQRLRTPGLPAQEAQQLQGLRQQFAQNPQMVQTIADNLVAQSPKQQEMKNARDVANIRANNVEKMEMAAWLKNNPTRQDGAPTDASDYQKFKVQQGVDSTVAKETNPQVLQARKDLAVATAQAEIPGKVEAARQEATVKQQIEGQTKLGYAFETATGHTVPISQTDYLANKDKYQAFRPVTEKELSDDRLLNNRLADVSQKIARYDATLQQPLNADDIAKMSAVIDPENKLKLGISHTELPVDSFNQVFKSSLMNHLSKEAQQRLIAYRNASEAMIGYQRVLSGSGRSSDKAMELNIASLPHPLNSPDYSNEAMSQFKENLKIAAQGLPTLPGLKSPEDVVPTMGNSQGGKSLTQAQIEKAAKDYGVSVDEAKRQAKAKGYTVPD